MAKCFRCGFFALVVKYNKEITNQYMNKNKIVSIRAVMIFVIMFSLGTVLGLTAYMLTIKKSPDIPVQPIPDSSIAPNPSDNPETDISDWKTYQNKDYGISFKYPSSWLLEKDSADKNLFGMSFSIENINTTLSVVGITNNYVDDGPPGWFGYCAVAYKDVDQFCKEGCIRINDKTATRRGRENHGDAGYSLLAYTNASKNFPSICWELDMGLILSKIADQKGIEYYKVKDEDVEAYIKENDKDENLKDIILKFEEFSQSIKSF